MIHRCGIRDPSAFFESTLSDLPPVFSKSLETTRAWMEGRPVWKVTVVLPFSLFDGHLSTPMLRVVLVPHAKFVEAASRKPSAQDVLSEVQMQSTENYFFDNVELDLKLTPGGGFEQVQISFLLQDRSLLKTHSGLVMNKPKDCVSFVIGKFSDRKHEVELFKRPYPWAWEKPSSISAAKTSGKAELIGEECRESADNFTIRFKIHWKGNRSKAPSGNFNRSLHFSSARLV